MSLHLEELLETESSGKLKVALHGSSSSRALRVCALRVCALLVMDRLWTDCPVSEPDQLQSNTLKPSTYKMGLACRPKWQRAAVGGSGWGPGAVEGAAQAGMANLAVVAWTQLWPLLLQPLIPVPQRLSR